MISGERRTNANNIFPTIPKQVGGLSAIAISAPSEKFLNMGGPLGIGLGVVFASSLGVHFYNTMDDYQYFMNGWLILNCISGL